MNTETKAGFYAAIAVSAYLVGGVSLLFAMAHFPVVGKAVAIAILLTLAAMIIALFWAIFYDRFYKNLRRKENIRRARDVEL